MSLEKQSLKEIINFRLQKLNKFEDAIKMYNIQRVI